MKKSFKIAAVILSAATITAALAGCGSGCNSCSGQTRNLASLRSNWYADTTFKNIQPTFIDDGTGAGAERLVYSVEKTGGTNATYSVDYAGGKYETYFAAKTFDDSLIDQAFKDGYTKAGNITAYYYKSELSFESVTFTVGKTKKEIKGDSAVTECYFMPVGEHLRPLYAKYSVKSATPTNLNVNSLEGAYVEVDYSRESFYSFDGDSVITKTKDNIADTADTVRADGLNSYADSVFDVVQLPIALRAMNVFSSALNQKVGLYTGNGIAAYNFVGSTSPLISGDNDKNAAQLAAVQNVLQNAGLFTPVATDDGVSALSTVAMSVSGDGKMPGVSQKYWFAAILNDRNNEGRATMVKKSEPLPYNLGSLEYVLTEVGSTLWNG